MIKIGEECIGCENCLNCGARNSETYYCDKCSEDVDPNHGYEIDGYTFCEDCGIEYIIDNYYNDFLTALIYYKKLVDRGEMELEDLKEINKSNYRQMLCEEKITDLADFIGIKIYTLK